MKRKRKAANGKYRKKKGNWLSEEEEKLSKPKKKAASAENDEAKKKNEENDLSSLREAAMTALKWLMRASRNDIAADDLWR